MKFTETKLTGAYIVELEPIRDNRGFFSRVICRHEFEELGLTTDFVQANLTFSNQKGTLRGMHYQIVPHKEVKLVRCTRGAIYDVIVDMRPDSPTYLQWLALELTADNRRMIYIPGEFAHGYMTLRDETEVFYEVAQFYAPEYERGFRWNDPAVNIEWPEADRLVMSDKDRAWPNFVPESVGRWNGGQAAVETVR